MEKKKEDQVARIVIDGAMRVHTAVGPGLLESAYEVCLVRELSKAGLQATRQVSLPVQHDGLKLDASGAKLPDARRLQTRLAD